MHNSFGDLHLTAILQKTLMTIGFILFVVLVVATIRIAGSQDAARNTSDLQPELRVTAQLRP